MGGGRPPRCQTSTRTPPPGSAFSEATGGATLRQAGGRGGGNTDPLPHRPQGSNGATSAGRPQLPPHLPARHRSHFVRGFPSPLPSPPPPLPAHPRGRGRTQRAPSRAPPRAGRVELGQGSSGPGVPAAEGLREEQPPEVRRDADNADDTLPPPLPWSLGGSMAAPTPLSTPQLGQPPPRRRLVGSGGAARAAAGRGGANARQSALAPPPPR